MKKRIVKRIVTFLLAVVMAAAMPISINAAESPAAPLSVNAKTATFNDVYKMFFANGDDDSYGQYDTTVVFQSASNTSNEVYSATVYPDIDWTRAFPKGITGDYKVMVIFQAVYQRLNHYTYGYVTDSYVYPYFNYTGANSGHFRAPSHTFYINKPTDDPLGFNYWVKYHIEIYLYLPSWEEGDDLFDFISSALIDVQYNDVINQF